MQSVDSSTTQKCQRKQPYRRADASTSCIDHFRGKDVFSFEKLVFRTKSINRNINKRETNHSDAWGKLFLDICYVC